MLKKKLELEAEWSQYYEKSSIYNGYRQIKCNDNNNFICPKTLNDELKKIKIEHKIFRKLQSINSWDGVMRKTPSGADYITIGIEDIYYSPGWNKKSQMDEKKIKETKTIYVVLNQLIQKCKVNINICLACKYFDRRLPDDYRISCKFSDIE